MQKILEPFDAGGEHPEIDQRTHATQHKDEQRGSVNPSPQLRTRCVHLRERQRHANHDRCPPNLFTSRGAINKIAAQRCAVAHRTSFARGECLLDLRPAQKILGGLPIALGIRQDVAGVVNQGDSRAAASDPFGPRAKLGGILHARRTRLRDIQERGKLIVGRANGIAPKNAGGVEINGKQDAQQQGEIRQPQFPEKPSSHGFRRGSRRRESSSCRPDAADRFRSSRATAAHIRPRCAASRTARSPRRRRAIDRA